MATLISTVTLDDSNSEASKFAGSEGGVGVSIKGPVNQIEVQFMTGDVPDNNWNEVVVRDSGTNAVLASTTGTYGPGDRATVTGLSLTDGDEVDVAATNTDEIFTILEQDSPSFPYTSSGGDVTSGQNEDSSVYGNFQEVSFYATTPAAPSSLSASASDGQIDLAWTDNSGFENEFRIYRAESSGTSVPDYNQIDTVSANTTSYSDTGLEDGERYYYRVTAVATDESDPTNEAVATTPLPATTPSLDAGSVGELGLSWTKQDDSADGQWDLYRSEDGSLGSEITGGLSPGTTSYTDTSVDDGERYYYTLRRVTDHVSADGAQQDAITILPAPSTPTLDASVEDEITVSWTLADNSSDGTVEIYRSADGSLGSVIETVTDLSVTSYTDTGLDDGERYYYTLRRVTDHASTESGQADAVTVLPAPTGLAVGTVTDDTAAVSWTDNHDTGQTEVQYRRTSEASWTTWATLAIGTESETLTGLLNGEAYDVRVVATTQHASTEDT